MLGSSPQKHAAAPSPLTAAYKDKHEQVLRIAASDVAAVTGYHEWVDIRDLFLERLLYQDLEHLLRIDAANVGIEVEDRRQRSERLLAKAGNRELRAVQKKAGDGAAVATVQDAQALRDKASLLLKDAEGQKRLSKKEAKELENDLRHDINTQFGTRNENHALNVYERRSGTEVICSNERILVWPFPGSKISGDDVPEGALDPPIELSKGWTKAESGRGSERHSTAAEAAFASATASCLAVLAARTAPERDGNGKLAPSSTAGGDASEAGRRLELDEGGVSGITTIDGAGERKDAGSGVGTSEMVMGWPPTAPVPEDSAGATPGSKRELVSGVPWPEWRGSIRRDPNAGETLTGKRDASADGVPSAVPSEGWTGEHGGLWFPSTLTPRQRNVVKRAAAELGLRHDSIAGEAGARHVVVWEPPPAVPSSSRSQSQPAASSTLATASAVVPSNTSSTRRASSVASQPTAAAAPAEMDTGASAGSVFTTSDVSGAPSIPAAHPRGRRLSRRGRLAMAMLEGQQTVSGEPAASAVEHKGKAPLAPLPNGQAMANACKRVTPTGQTGNREGAAIVAPPRLPRRVSFRVEEFGGKPVYAWGEGPAATAADAAGKPALPGAREDAGEEWSVWSRSSQTPSPPAPGNEGCTRGVPKAGWNGAAGTEEAPSVAFGARSPSRPDGQEGGRAETLRERRENACFVVVGAVDGVAEEVTDAPEDAETWETRRVVVEVKNRMNKAKDPPPLYDQIQLVTYMLMVGASVGDLVQFVKTGAGRRNDRAGVPTILRSTTEDDVLVSRVELDCRAYRHRKHWRETILPRLYSFARMVYRFRGDDLLRWRYLLATPEEQREMLVECCPYLDSVIPRMPAAATRLAPAAETVKQASASSDVIDLRGGGVGETEMTPTVHPFRGESGGTPGSKVEEALSAVQARSNGCGGDAPATKGGVKVGGVFGGDAGDGDAGVRSCGGAARNKGDGDGGGCGDCRPEDACNADKNLKEISSTCITVLSQRTRPGEAFLDPLRDVEVSSMGAASVTSPVRKKSKVGDGSAFNQPNHANRADAQGVKI